MPADLDYRADRSVILAVAEKAAWHRGGTLIARRIKREELDVLVPEWAAPVEARPMYGTLGDEVVELPDNVMHVRLACTAPDGTPVPETIVGVVGRHRYQLVQNTTMFDLGERIMGLRESAEVASAMTLREGKVSCLSLYLGEEYLVPGMDSEKLGRYLNFINSFDASYALTATNSDVRIECTNTMRWNATVAPRRTKIRHTGDMEVRLDDARVALGMADRYADLQAVMAEHLIDEKVTGAGVEEFVANLVPLPVDKETGRTAESGRALTTAQSLRETLHTLYAEDPTLDSIRGTRYGLLNLTTLYTNHHQGRRSTRTGSPEDNRFDALVMDDTSPLETRAQRLLSPDSDEMARLFKEATRRTKARPALATA